MSEFEDEFGDMVDHADDDVRPTRNYRFKSSKTQKAAQAGHKASREKATRKGHMNNHGRADPKRADRGLRKF